jgi:hypothetical protein
MSRVDLGNSSKNLYRNECCGTGAREFKSPRSDHKLKGLASRSIGLSSLFPQNANLRRWVGLGRHGATPEKNASRNGCEPRSSKRRFRSVVALLMSALGGEHRRGQRATTRANDPTDTLPIDYCPLRGLYLYATLYEDRRALCLARADGSMR